MRRLMTISLCALLGTLSACAGGGPRLASVDALSLDRVVLYRNGIGYFERRGEVEGDLLRIRCRKDQVNDILKSIVVVDKGTGQALSISMPLDPQSWANAAFAALKPGQGNLGSILDSLRGTWVTLKTGKASHAGRLLMVAQGKNHHGTAEQRVSLLDEDEVIVVPLADVEKVRFQDGDLAMQLNRSLDATSGEGIFQQVTVEVRLSEAGSHDLMISYVVAAPIWKPTYRVVLSEEGDALLQAWAVVDNISGEDWRAVRMSLTSGAPIAFRFDLRTPRNVTRPDLSALGTAKRARVALGESSYGKKKAKRSRRYRGSRGSGGSGAGAPMSRSSPAPAAFARESELQDDEGLVMGSLLDGLRKTTRVRTAAAQVAGLTRYDLGDRVTVPDGTSTMVAILNQRVKAEQAFLYRPGGGGVGYEQNPYRVVRFTNSSPFVLETGPISIYAGGSFVGEGIANTIGAGAKTTVPFSVESEIHVTSSASKRNGEARLLGMARGVLTLESWRRYETTWKVRAPKSDRPRKVLVRQTSRGSAYKLKDAPKDTEEVAGAWLLPVIIEPGETSVTLKVVEQTPSRRNVSIWNHSVPKVLSLLLEGKNLDPATLKKLAPVIRKRQEIADIDRETVSLQKRKRDLDQRADQTRRNLEAIKKDPAASRLRSRLNRRLEGFTKDADKLARRVVELATERLEKKIEVDEQIGDITVAVP